jgi:hypothetical protein
MSVKFVFDENVSSVLWEAVQEYNRAAVVPLEVTRVGDPPDLPKSSNDRTLLLWAERHGCILVSHDKKTLPGFLAEHLAQGHHVPGLFFISYYASPAQIIELLAVAGSSDDPTEWNDLIEYLS